jgi:septum formation protein
LLAEQKAAFVSLRHPGRYVVGADQTLSVGDRLFNKPTGRDQAAQQLRDLSGKTHELHSAIALACDGATIFSYVSVAHMTMRQLDDDAIDAYLDAAGDKVTTSVGAYQLEGLGVHLFELIEGDHFTILGLPLLPLLKFLRGERMLAI